jgi:hypothetical protein
MARRLNACDHLIGRDFGYRNTAALSVVRRTREITASELERIAAFTKKSAEAYLSGHGIDCSDAGADALEMIETSLHDGSDFLGRIAAHSRRIDGYRSDIDCGYERVGRIRALLLPLLGLGPEDRIPEDAAATAPGLEPRVLRLVTRFLQILASIRRLKAKRREAYAAIAGIKKSWFGWLSTKELELARKYGAAVIREDLDIVAPEKETPEYKGRTFAKMITSGAKGLYRRRASNKLRWNGIPEHAIPSFFTSCTCPRHSRVDRQQRRGDRFLCPDCGGPEHADTHAAFTIACYLLLTPVKGPGSAVVKNPPSGDGSNQTFDPASPAGGEDTALQEALSL